jgi:hypothetical protein
MFAIRTIDFYANIVSGKPIRGEGYLPSLGRFAVIEHVIAARKLVEERRQICEI